MAFSSIKSSIFSNNDNKYTKISDFMREILSYIPFYLYISPPNTVQFNKKRLNFH